MGNSTSSEHVSTRANAALLYGKAVHPNEKLPRGLGFAWLKTEAGFQYTRTYSKVDWIPSEAATSSPQHQIPGMIYRPNNVHNLTLDGEVVGHKGPLAHPLRIRRGASVTCHHGLVDVLLPL